jgi:GrpB-like predicted nucleotidyltransferase (UPF0157 family)
MGKLRNVIVVPYDSGWSQGFQDEAAKIVVVFGQELISIHHIGSTSIPGISAKPIIDMLSIVRNIEKVEMFCPDLMQLDYEPMGEYGIPGRRLFFKGSGSDTDRTHIVHTFEPDHPEVIGLLSFRDYLIAHPREAQQYANLKEELARQFRHDIVGYTAGKKDFIQEVLQKAHRWCAEQVQ